MAAKSELSIAHKSISVPSTTLIELQGEPAFPRQSTFRSGHLPVLSSVSVGSAYKGATTNTQLIKPTIHHGRSFEIHFGKTQDIFWEDEYGILFGALTSKGNNLEDPQVRIASNLPSGFLFQGLMESTSMIRILRASHLMRKGGIETETMIRVMQPDELPYQGKMISLEQFKKKLVQGVWELDGKGEIITRKDIPKLSEELNKMTFFIVTRGLQTPERMLDLTTVKTKKQFKTMMKRAFRFVNQSERLEHAKDALYAPEVFDTKKQEDIERYFNMYLPKKMARQYGKLHNMGLVHYYPHAGNISTVGSIYDLDSVKGAPLNCGDQPITDKDIEGDIDFILHGQILPGQGTSQGMRHVLETVKKFVPHIENFDATFLEEYIDERFGKSYLSHLPEIQDVITNASDKDELQRKLVPKLEEESKWHYPFGITNDTAYYINLIRQNRFRTIYDLRDTPKEEKEVICADVGVKIREKHTSAIQALEEQYGKETTNALVMFYADIENTTILDRVLGSMFENPEEFYNYYQQKIKESGWEKDICAYMPQIIELFGHFNTQETREYLEYYIKLLAEQTRLQVDFTPKELDKTLMKTLSIFREKYKSVLADVESVADAVVNKEELEAHVYSPEDDDLSTYWREELIPSLLNKLVVSRDKAVFDGIEEKYDEETLGRVEQVLLKHAENALYDYLDDGKMKRLLNRINEIKKELEKQLVEKLAKELDTPEKEPTLV